MPAADPGDVVDHLPDALLEIEADRVAVADPRTAELRDARDGDRRTVDGARRRGAELCRPRILNAQFVQDRRPQRGHELCRGRVHPVGEIGRAIGGGQATGNVRFGEVLEKEVASRQPVARRELVIDLAEPEVHGLIGRDDTALRQRDAETGRVLRCHRDDLRAGDQAAVDELVCAEEVRLVAKHRPAQRAGEVVDLRIGLARRRREKEGRSDMALRRNR